ncbi:unnamed protein product [Nesidiocoris tenuis]|uniref:Uncharacterized protein n=1 Tax=Nesidiocoris tenuis TaxID=355587 RepID=A0A6H5FVM3_9HEMI|nr:unnamed protein product [Nesidiocoris tenuis]CAA9993264.1 unnamed protein product [Nesidiocoris tenuis]
MGQNDRRTEFYLIGENQLNYVKQNFKHPWATYTGKIYETGDLRNGAHSCWWSYRTLRSIV